MVVQIRQLLFVYGVYFHVSKMLGFDY